jgi:hypothetical protein
VTTTPAIEAHESSRGTWLRARRTRLALVIGLVESLVILVSDDGWFVVLALAALAVALYFFVGRASRHHSVRELTWIAAASQLIAMLVPVLWVLVKGVAIAVLVVMALILLVLLLVDRNG